MSKAGPRALFNMVGAASLSLLTACATPGSQIPNASSDAVRAEAERQRGMVAARQLPAGPATRFSGFPPQQRLSAVMRPVMIAGADQCGAEVKTTYPVVVGNPNLGAPVIMTGSTGLEFGDRIVSVNGQPIVQNARGTGQYLDIQDAAAARQQPLAITAQRGGQVVSASVAPVRACSHAMHLINTGKFNAYALGQDAKSGNTVMSKGIYFEEKLVSLLPEDAMLAAVGAHELAHLTKGHSASKVQNAMLGAGLGVILDILAATQKINTQGAGAKMGAGFGANAYSPAFEKEADYVGTYTLAKAGYDPMASVRLAQFMASQNPAAIERATTHPSTADRAATAMGTVEEIRTKLDRRQPLAPN